MDKKTEWSAALKSAQDCNRTISVVEAQLCGEPLPEMPDFFKEMFGKKKTP